MSRVRIAAMTVCLAALGCGAGGGGAGSAGDNPCAAGGTRCGAVRLALAAINSGVPVVTSAAARSAALSEAAPPEWLAGSILSGPPDAMRIHLKEIDALDASSRWIPLWTSPDAGGTAIDLTAGNLDLGAILGASLSLPAGDYRQVRVTLSRVAQFKGCLSGKFIASTPTTTTITSGDMLGTYQPRHIGNTYTNDPITDGASHTFCTQAARSELSQPTFSTGHIGSNAEFQAPGDPELVDVDLARSNDDGSSPDEIRAATITAGSPLSFSVAEGQESRLTLAVDLDRQLRYFANTRTDFNPPNPGMKTGTSYFFTTVFPDTVMVVAGDVSGGASAGWIEGYKLAITNPAPSTSGMDLQEWLTVVRGPDGGVLAGAVIPDDDNDLTIAKGSLAPQACVDQGADGWTLGFELGTEGATGSLDGFTFLGDVGLTGSCGLTRLPHTDPDLPSTGFVVSYERRL